MRTILAVVAGAALVACGSSSDEPVAEPAPAEEEPDVDPVEDATDEDATDEDAAVEDSVVEEIDDGEDAATEELDEGRDDDEPDESGEPGDTGDVELAFDPDGPMQFEVVGEELIAVGVIDGSTPGVFADVMAANPDVTTLLLSLVPGSADDEANLQLARDVRDRGLLTVVPAEGLVASGGTDLFLAGIDREIDPGACLGVHSWSAGDFDGTDLPRDDPEHDRYLDYYDEIGIDADFYWFTLEAAPADGMYWMNEADMGTYGVVTAGSAATAVADDCESRL